MDTEEWSMYHPDIPKPQIESGGTVIISANGATLEFSFPSQAEATDFINVYAKACLVMGSWTGILRRINNE